MWAGGKGLCAGIGSQPAGRSLLKGPLGIAGPASPWSWPVSVTPKSCSAHSWPGLSSLKGSSRPHTGLLLATWDAHCCPGRQGSYLVPPVSLSAALTPFLFSPRTARPPRPTTRQRTGPFPAPWLHCPRGRVVHVLACGALLTLDHCWVLGPQCPPPEQPHTLKPAGPCWSPPWDASQLVAWESAGGASLGGPGLCC